MRRRDFIKISSAAGITGLLGNHLDLSAASAAEYSGFDLHPFIREHPEAVFIYLTDVKEKTDKQATHDAALRLSGEMFIKTSGGKGISNKTRITCKPNWTCANPDKKNPNGHLGINTDPNFIEGFLKGVKEKGPQQFFLRECACTFLWKTHGYSAMAERNGFDLRDLTAKHYWELGDDIIFQKVNNGVVFKEVGFMAPITAPDTFLINIAKFKAHQMGITGAIKNLQGTTGRTFHSFCGGAVDIFKTIDKRYHQFFHSDYLERVGELHRKHVAAGYPRWTVKMDRPPFEGGFWMEQWVQRMLDAYSVTPVGLNVIEGVYGRDGDGFNGGPHNGKPMDYMSNLVIFGKDAFRTDIIAHWLAGHEPGNFGLFHAGIERGFSNVLDPFDIPVYLWKNGKAKKVKLDTLTRTPLLTYYLQKTDINEDKYHMVNEPFDYKAWKSGATAKIEEPAIRALGTDADNKVVMEVLVPEKGDVFVDILNKHGEVVWRMHADDLEPGTHQVVWDGFSQPGLYNMYVKGMGWDAEREMVIYT